MGDGGAGFTLCGSKLPITNYNYLKENAVADVTTGKVLYENPLTHGVGREEWFMEGAVGDLGGGVFAVAVAVV